MPAGIENIIDNGKELLTFISSNFFILIIALAVIIFVALKIKNFSLKSKEEQIEIAKKQISEIILKLISDAEFDYEEWEKSGAIKRSQVIKRIFEDFPILSKIINQEEIISWIDILIDEALVTLRNIINKK